MKNVQQFRNPTPAGVLKCLEYVKPERILDLLEGSIEWMRRRRD